MHGTKALTLLFCDTKTEDADTYRFMREAAANVGGQLVEIADGRTIWEVFEEKASSEMPVSICAAAS